MAEQIQGSIGKVISRYTLIPVGAVIGAILMTIVVVRATDTRITVLEFSAAAMQVRQDKADSDRDLIKASIQVQADRLSDISGRLDLILYRLGELQAQACHQLPGGNKP